MSYQNELPKVQVEQTGYSTVVLIDVNWLRWKVMLRTVWHLILNTVACVFHVSVHLRPHTSPLWAWSYTQTVPGFEFRGKSWKKPERPHAVIGNKEAVAGKRLMAIIGKEPASCTMVLFIYINLVLMCFSGSGLTAQLDFFQATSKCKKKQNTSIDFFWWRV